MYRDEGEAARLRIETLEAKLAERDAMIAARDAELHELAARVERLDPTTVETLPRPRRSWPILTGAMMFLIAASSLSFVGMKPRGEAIPARRAVEPRTTTGVAACDEYLFRLELCISRLDPSVRDALATSLRATREGWWSAGATAAGQEKLVTTCEGALDALALNPFCE